VYRLRVLRIPDPPTPTHLGVDPFEGLTFQHLSLSASAYGPQSLSRSGNRVSRYRDSRCTCSRNLLCPEPRYGVTPVLHSNACDYVVVAFQSFTTSPAMIFTSPKIPIYRSPMHVRTDSSTSLSPRRSIGHRAIAIPDAVISSLPEFTKCRTPTPLQIPDACPAEING
jgi:hypothetical protein